MADASGVIDGVAVVKGPAEGDTQTLGLVDDRSVTIKAKSTKCKTLIISRNTVIAAAIRRHHDGAISVRFTNNNFSKLSRETVRHLAEKYDEIIVAGDDLKRTM